MKYTDTFILTYYKISKITGFVVKVFVYKHLAPLDIQLNKMKRVDGKASKKFRHLCRSQLLIFKKRSLNCKLLDAVT